MSTNRWRSLIAVTSLGLIFAGCGATSTSPSGEPSSLGSQPPAQASPPALTSPPATTLQLAWDVVGPSPDLAAKRGFEHTFPVSERGAMILARYLEGLPETLRARTRDGSAWAVETVPSKRVPFGYSVNGGADWLQVVPRTDGPGLELLASADGVNWEPRGMLPADVRTAADSAVNGSSLILCGLDPVDRVTCAISANSGQEWQAVSIVEGMSSYGQGIRGLAPLGDGFIAIVEGEQAGRHVVATSPDGVTWTRRPDISAIGGLAMAPLGRRVVVAGMRGDPAIPFVAVTADGATWEDGALPSGSIGLSELIPVDGAMVGVGRVIEPEGADHVSELLLSRDGLVWQPTTVPGSLTTWQSPTILPVRGGLVALLGPAGETMVGRLVTE